MYILIMNDQRVWLSCRRWYRQSSCCCYQQRYRQQPRDQQLLLLLHQRQRPHQRQAGPRSLL